jgi:phosphatidylglycerophosphatase A
MYRVISSFFGTGLILGRIRGSDSGSGTLGALMALPIALWLGSWAGWAGQVIAAVAVSGISVWATSALAEQTGDAGWIVIDEVAGTFVSTIGLGGWAGLVAFVVFRLADIQKNWFPGVAQAERLRGGIGITADDLIAGGYGLLAGLVLASTLL